MSDRRSLTNGCVALLTDGAVQLTTVGSYSRKESQGATDVVRADDPALDAAMRGGRAPARLLAVTDVDVPALARELAPTLRDARSGGPA